MKGLDEKVFYNFGCGCFSIEVLAVEILVHFIGGRRFGRGKRVDLMVKSCRKKYSIGDWLWGLL